MFNSVFDGLTGSTLDFYPRHLRQGIDTINDTIYDRVNNGVYKCGFATAQQPYEEAFAALFAPLDALAPRLAPPPYLPGDRLTEAYCRLSTTPLRLSPVSHTPFHCNLKTPPPP